MRKYVEKVHSQLTHLKKDDLSRRKVAVGVARLAFDRARLFIAIGAAFLTAVGLLYGYRQFSSFREDIANERKLLINTLIKERSSNIELQVALDFFKLKPDERPAFIASLREFGALDKAFIEKMENSISVFADKSLNVTLFGTTPIPDDILADLGKNLQHLTSGSSKKRRAARERLAELITQCGIAECFFVVANELSSEALITGERYRLSLGIAVALSSVKFDVSPDLLASVRKNVAFEKVLQKLETLKTFEETAIRSAADRAVMNLSGQN